MVIGIFIGAIIWLLFELNKAYKKSDFVIKKFIELNWLPLIINIVCGLTVLWFKDEIKDILPMTKVNSVILGISGQGMFKKIIGIFDKRIETKFGMNVKNV